MSCVPKSPDGIGVDSNAAEYSKNVDIRQSPQMAPISLRGRGLG